jgi:hypothetical protein
MLPEFTLTSGVAELTVVRDVGAYIVTTLPVAEALNPATSQFPVFAVVQALILEAMSDATVLVLFEAEVVAERIF